MKSKLCSLSVEMACALNKMRCGLLLLAVVLRLPEEENTVQHAKGSDISKGKRTLSTRLRHAGCVFSARARDQNKDSRRLEKWKIICLQIQSLILI